MKRFKAILFLLTFCFSTLGYSFELHYCKGEVTDISFIGHAKCVCADSHVAAPVHDDEEGCEKSCHDDNEKQAGDEAHGFKKCCKTEKLAFFSPSVKALSSHHMPAFELVIIATVFNPYIFHDFYAVAPQCPVEYSAPLPDRDITVLTRTFLI